MIFRFVLLFSFIYSCVPLLAAQGLKHLPETVAILQEVHQVSVHEKSNDSVTLSWGLRDGRKIGVKTLEILQKVGELSEKPNDWYFHLSVFCQQAEGEHRARSLAKSQSKAETMKKALSKFSSEKAEVVAVGLGSEVNKNIAYLTIKQNGKQAVQLLVPTTVNGQVIEAEEVIDPLLD